MDSGSCAAAMLPPPFARPPLESKMQVGEVLLVAWALRLQAPEQSLLEAQLFGTHRRVRHRQYLLGLGWPQTDSYPRSVPPIQKAGSPARTA